MHLPPPEIGPHEGREFDLMRQGRKDVALFFELRPDGLDAMLNDGFKLLRVPQFVFEDTTYFTYIVYRSGFRASAERLMELTSLASNGLDPQREYEIGAILSYTPQQVDAYIKHARSGTG